MLNRFFFAVAPMLLVAGSVMADDSLLSRVATMDLDGANAAVADVEADNLGQADVDALLGDDQESSEDAIAACFRRIGWGYGYRSCYRPFYRSCYRPFYRTYHYPALHCYTPVTYSYYTPIYRSYWGCW